MIRRGSALAPPEEMTLKQWVESRTPMPPPALMRRMHPALTRVDAAGATTPDRAALDAALELAQEILGDGNAARGGAITLLAADALVTYAFEAAADDPDRLDALAVEAMNRIAATAETSR